MSSVLLESKQVALNLSSNFFYPNFFTFLQVKGIPQMSKFNIITFGSVFEPMFLSSVVMSQEHADTAVRYIQVIKHKAHG